MTATRYKWLRSIPRGRQKELLERHEAFWRREPGSRALIGFSPNTHVFPIQNFGIEHEGLLRAEDISEAVMRADTKHRPPFDPQDDLFPAKIPLEYMEWSQGYCGAQVFLSTKAQTVWAGSGDNIPKTVDELKTRVQIAWLEKLVEATQINVEAATDELLISESP